MQFYDIFSMQLEDLDDDNPLKKQFCETVKINRKGPIVFFGKLPLELQEQIIEELVEDNDKATILSLCYAVSYLYLSNKTKREVKSKIALYHAVHIITQLPLCKTEEDRTALFRLASNANNGDTYWSDIPQYSLWGNGIGLKSDIKRQFKKYLENTQEHAENLDERLHAHFNRLCGDEETYLQNDKSRIAIIKEYYASRSLLLDDSHQLEGKFRSKANNFFKSCCHLRYCAPYHCCYIGTGGLVTASLTNPSVVVGWMMVGFSFSCILASCVLTAMLCDSNLQRDCFDSSEEVDYWKRLTGIPDTKQYITLTQNEIAKLKNKTDFELIKFEDSDV
jgi:hypothetical protein